MTGQTVILHGDLQRAQAKQLIDCAPANAVVNIKQQKRTIPQNAKMWSMLSDISRAKPEGRCHTTDVWKCIFMNACGHQIQFVPGLDGEVFPMGFKSSQLTLEQMITLIDFIYWYGAQHGVVWSDERQAA